MMKEIMRSKMSKTTEQERKNNEGPKKEEAKEMMCREKADEKECTTLD